MKTWGSRRRLGRAQQRQTALSVARLTAAVLSGPMLLVPSIGGPWGTATLLWVVLSALATGVASLRGVIGERCSIAVAALDVVAIVAVGTTSPAGIGPMLLLGVVQLVHVPMRWGVRGALLAGAPFAAVAWVYPSPNMTGVASGPASVLVVTAQLTLGYAIGWFVSRQDALHDQTSLTLSLTFEHSPAGTALLTEDGVLLMVNPALALLAGTPAADLEGRRLCEMVVAEDAAIVEHATIAPTGSDAGGLEVRLDARGGPHWVRLRLARVPGSVNLAARTLVQVEDVAEHRATAQRLAHDADHDALTGLPNRRVLGRRLAQLAGDHRAGTGLVLLDLDGFKAVNDLLGHEAGDDLLVVVADRLRTGLRPGESALRLAGDEMVVLVTDVTTDDDARLAGERVLHGLVGPATVRAGQLEIRASAGTRRIVPGDDPAAVLREADTALYLAKRAGRGRVEVARTAGAERPTVAVEVAPAS